MTLLYIVECCDGTLYTGITKDLEKRLKKHNSGHGAKYTAMRLPVKLMYLESCASWGEALKREREIKKMKRSAKQKLINNAAQMD